LILVITTRDHAYTHAAVAKERRLDVVVVSYEEILGRKKLHHATHIFTDLDRLPAWQVHDAALFFRKLQRAGIKALNDPARFRNRFGLLRALNRAGINDFDAYPADSLETPRRWPVFIRLEGNHRAPISGLLQDQEELDRAIEDAIDKGAPRSSMLILEYCSEPVRPGLSTLLESTTAVWISAWWAAARKSMRSTVIRWSNQSRRPVSWTGATKAWRYSGKTISKRWKQSIRAADPPGWCRPIHSFAPPASYLEGPAACRELRTGS
jgi:hypothetical protein